jgi:RNA-binding protein
MDPLLPAFRRELRARAHGLHPVVSIGHHGLTPAVLREIDVALRAHELVKVRVGSDERDERDASMNRICAELGCGAVQQIGKLLVLWRPRPAEPDAAGKASHVRKGKTAPRHDRKGVTARTRPGGETYSSARPPGGKPRRRRAGEPAALAPVATARRKTAPGKAPLGVPRAAMPRRRRSAP